MKGNFGSIYLKSVSEQLPRLLGLLDRNPLSRTYGCFDRQYWHYRTVDFASTRSQEAVLILALLYSNKSTKYYQSPLILDWINASLDFWTKIQSRNGSFSEWYPKENSFVATAFSSYAVSETLLLLKDKIKNQEKIIASLEKACKWLSTKRETIVQNQESGAIAAIYNIYLLTENPIYKQIAKAKTLEISEKQSTEGWFYEYGGADIGYLSLTIDYLAKYYKKSKDENALKAATKAIDFISYFIHPNLTFGGEYASRNTEYLIPDGFEILSEKNKKAAAISKAIRDSLKNKTTIAPSSLDDRYLTYISYTWLQAGLDSKNISASLKIEPFKHFKEAGIVIVNNKNYYLILNYKKGGAFKLFFKNSNKVVYDAGLQIKSGKNSYISSFLSKNLAAVNKNNIKIYGNFYKINTNPMTPIKNILLRSFQLVFGSSDLLGFLIKNFLRRKLITSAKPSSFKFSREFTLNENIRVEDIIRDINKVDELIIGGKFSYSYIPSSRYFQESELNSTQITLIKAEIVNKTSFLREYDQKGNLKFLTKPLYRK